MCFQANVRLFHQDIFHTDLADILLAVRSFMQHSKIEDASRKQISDFLPDAIARALQSYYRFAQQDAPFEAKEFSAHHGACKVAIAHIELLIKLAKWADLPDVQAEDHGHQIVLAAMMQEAQKELQDYKKNKNTKAKDDTGK